MSSGILWMGVPLEQLERRKLINAIYQTAMKIERGEMWKSGISFGQSVTLIPHANGTVRVGEIDSTDLPDSVLRYQLAVMLQGVYEWEHSKWPERQARAKVEALKVRRPGPYNVMPPRREAGLVVRLLGWATLSIIACGLQWVVLASKVQPFWVELLMAVLVGACIGQTVWLYWKWAKYRRSRPK